MGSADKNIGYAQDELKPKQGKTCVYMYICRYTYIYVYIYIYIYNIYIYIYIYIYTWCNNNNNNNAHTNNKHITQVQAGQTLCLFGHPDFAFLSNKAQRGPNAL